ncbi:3925_t:CDS:10 [Entrophospora sp. SA101]|nr:3925_t:CDS:10 [Entrophospora sp. SA101]
MPQIEKTKKQAVMLRPSKTKKTNLPAKPKLTKSPHDYYCCCAEQTKQGIPKGTKITQLTSHCKQNAQQLSLTKQKHQQNKTLPKPDEIIERKGKAKSETCPDQTELTSQKVPTEKELSDNLDQLQAELKKKVKPGIKPSHLRKSKSLSDIPVAPPLPNTPLQKSKSQLDIPTQQPTPEQQISQLKQTLTFTQNTAQNYLASLQVAQAKITELEAELKSHETFIDAPEENPAELKTQISQLEEQILQLRLDKIKDFGDYYEQKKVLETELEENISEGINEINRLENQLLATNKKKLELQQQLNQTQTKNTKLELKLLNNQAPETNPNESLNNLDLKVIYNFWQKSIKLESTLDTLIKDIQALNQELANPSLTELQSALTIASQKLAEIMLKNKLELLHKEFTTLKNKITTKLAANQQTISETNHKLQESNRKLETTLKENSENEKVLEQEKIFSKFSSARQQQQSHLREVLLSLCAKTGYDLNNEELREYWQIRTDDAEIAKMIEIIGVNLDRLRELELTAIRKAERLEEQLRIETSQYQEQLKVRLNEFTRLEKKLEQIRNFALTLTGLPPALKLLQEPTPP